MAILFNIIKQTFHFECVFAILSHACSSKCEIAVALVAWSCRNAAANYLQASSSPHCLLSNAETADVCSDWFPDPASNREHGWPRCSRKRWLRSDRIQVIFTWMFFFPKARDVCIDVSSDEVLLMRKKWLNIYQRSGASGETNKASISG